MNKIKLEVQEDSYIAHHSLLANDNELLPLSENSNESIQEEQSSEDQIPTTVQYEITNTEGVLQYRVLNIPNETANVMATPAASNTQPLNCQFYVINSITPAAVVTKRPVPITPKLSNNGNGNKANQRTVVTTGRRRDEKRRATHNEVERRRRDKINHWILKLKELLPSENEDTKIKPYGTDSKGGILVKACEYIRRIQGENVSLTECLSQNEQLVAENTLLCERNDRLRKENEKLKLLLATTDILFDFESS